ncbi:MAG: NAD(P)/FAD-dependent oxidoreductase [Candidatus Promineifilaceae bacterium]
MRECGHQSEDDSCRVVVVGAGPAGLTAAYELAREGARPLVLEARDRPGGLARSECYRGYTFDLGGHRFFSKSAEVNELWRLMLGARFLRRPRLSRIHFNGRLFHYPLQPWNTLANLGPVESARILASYLRWRIAPHKQESSFEEWVTNRFGRRLYQKLFQSYTEKVWGRPGSEIRAEWAAQRIRNLSLRAALLAAFRRPGRQVASLIEEFHYPALGPGMMWEAFAAAIERLGGQVWLNAPVTGFEWDGRRVTSLTAVRQGRAIALAADAYISSMPLGDLTRLFKPAAPGQVQAASASLRYRSLIVVGLIVNEANLFPDNWIYVHEPGLRVARIQNYKNWSPAMAADSATSHVGLEYFCDEGDDLWRLSEAELIALAREEFARLGLARGSQEIDGCVFRLPRSYPIYDQAYEGALTILRGWLEGMGNLQTIGRNGLHRYDNQDHAMLTGLLAARNLLYGERNDVWAVNAEGEYHEERPADQDSGAVGNAPPNWYNRPKSRAASLRAGREIGVRE